MGCGRRPSLVLCPHEVDELMTPAWSSAVVVISVAATLFRGAPARRLDEGAALSGGEALSSSFQLPLPSAEERLRGLASKYGNLSPGECRRRLANSPFRSAFERLGPRNGIATPLRFVGALGEIQFRVPPPKSAFGNLDCRQALLWTEVLPILQAHGVVAVRIDNFYRNHARIRKGKKSQHAYGLAADITSIVFDAPETAETARTGAALPSGSGTADIERDFLGKRGAPVCGPEAHLFLQSTSDAEQIGRATRLRNLICELARQGAFHHILTPNYDAAHRNHLHLDLQRDNKWFSVE